MSLFFFLWREGTPDTFTLLFVCCPLIKISVNEKSAMPFPDKNEPSRIAGSCFVGGNYTRHEQRCCTVRPKNKYGLLCKTHPPVSFVMSKFQKQNKKCYLCATSVSISEGTVSLCKANKKQGVLRWFLMWRWLYGPYETTLLKLTDM